jgi:hypothetical protein
MPRKKLKIEVMGLGSEVSELRNKSESYMKIAEILNKKYTLSLNHMDIKRFLDKHLDAIVTDVAMTDEGREKSMAEFNEIVGQMKKLTSDMWEYFNKIKATDFSDSAVPAAANTILKLLETEHKLLDRVIEKPRVATINQKISIVAITDDIDKMVQKLASLGYVVVKKPEQEDSEITNAFEILRKKRAILIQ